MYSLVLLSIVIIVVCYELFYDRKTKECARKLPGPTALPFIGNGHMFIGSSTKFRKTLEYLFREFGDRTRAFIGPDLFLFISNPEDVEALTNTMDFIDKSEDYEMMKPWLGEGLLTSTGQKWKKQRKFLTPTFHFKILQEFLPVFESNARILVKMMSHHGRDGKVFDIFPYITLCALDDICETSMGVNIGAQKNANCDYVKAVKRVAALMNSRMRHFLLRNEIFFSISKTKFEQTKALKVIHDFSEKVIRDRRKQLDEGRSSKVDNNEQGLKKKTTFLDLLLLSELDGQKLSDECVREQVDTFMFEGHDTTTSALCFTLHMISKHPDVQKKLQTEQEEIFSDDINRDIAYSDISNMKYMELVIKESLRLFPSVPLVGRRMIRDSKINGIDLVAGTTILIDLLHLQRNPKYFDDPLTFKPERFEVENVNKRNPFSWIAFSAGPRNCIGQKFAMLEMKSTLSRLLRSFEFTDGGVEPELALDLILTPLNGINLSIKNRNAS